MTKILCPCVECTHNSDQVCKAKKIILSMGNIATAHEGRRDIWVCNQYEATELYKKIESEFIKYIDKQGTHGT